MNDDAYYAGAVSWAVANGVTNGTSQTNFSPDKACTRGQVVTFLWRACGSPEPKNTSNPFTDVNSGDYYYKAVLWAKETGVTSGTSATKFSPGNGCTRAQVVTFLWRANGQPVPRTGSSPFRDVTGGYYYQAVLWAVENGITSGTSATTFSPDRICTRGQIVTFLFRSEQKAPALSEDEQQTLARLNQERKARGLSELRFNYRLMDCAELRVKELPISFGKDRPDGSAWYTVFHELGYAKPEFAGQAAFRLATKDYTWEFSYNNSIAPTSVYESTLMRSEFTDVAVAIRDGGNGITYTVFILGSATKN